MCMSPDEHTSADLERQLEILDGYIAEGDDYWTLRADGIRDLLKERAENGTYATAGY